MPPQRQERFSRLCGCVQPLDREHLWWVCSGAEWKERSYPPAYYDTLLQRSEELPTSLAEQICLDVPRAFPGKTNGEPNQETSIALQQVLMAFAVHNPEVC